MDVVLRLNFVEIKIIAWVTLNEDLSGQIYVGKNELALRAVCQSKERAEAKLEGDAVTTVKVGCDDEMFESLRGMLNTSDGNRVMSVSACRRIGSLTLTL